MNKRLLGIVVAIIVVMGIAAVVLMVLANQKSNTSTTTTSSSASPSASTSSFTPAQSGTNSILSADVTEATEKSKTRFVTAKDKISQWSMWKSNAAFSGLFISIGANLELDSANEVYVFDSDQDSTNHYTISVSQQTGNTLRAIIPKADYQGSLLAIDSSYWKTNYVEAIQLADKNGGSDFRGKNTITGIDANLQRATPNNYLYWIVTYKTADTSNYLTIKIDASTKAIVTE